MSQPNDPNQTADLPAASDDSLDACLAAGFAAPAVGAYSTLFKPSASLVSGGR